MLSVLATSCPTTVIFFLFNLVPSIPPPLFFLASVVFPILVTCRPSLLLMYHCYQCCRMLSLLFLTPVCLPFRPFFYSFSLGPLLRRSTTARSVSAHPCQQITTAITSSCYQQLTTAKVNYLRTYPHSPPCQSLPPLAQFHQRSCGLFTKLQTVLTNPFFSATLPPLLLLPIVGPSSVA